MNFLILILSLLFSLALQCSILPYFSVAGVSPNLILAIVVSISLIGKKPYGRIFGLALGIVEDILFSSIVGVNALIYFLIGYVIESIDFHLSRDNIYIPIFSVLLATIAYNLLYFIIMYFAERDLSIMYFIKYRLWIELIYNGVISIFTHKLTARIFVAPVIRFYRE